MGREKKHPSNPERTRDLTKYALPQPILGRKVSRGQALSTVGKVASAVVATGIIVGGAEYAEYSSCDLIVIGSRGYGPLKRAILGSTSSAVAGVSKNSVLILK